MQRIDWRWIAIGGTLVVVLIGPMVPWFVRVAVLLGAGGYLLWYGWGVWTRGGSAFGQRNVTYWRGQRIETGPARRGPAIPQLRDIGPALIWLVLGLILLLTGLAIGLARMGL